MLQIVAYPALRRNHLGKDLPQCPGNGTRGEMLRLADQMDCKNTLRTESFCDLTKRFFGVKVFRHGPAQKRIQNNRIVLARIAIEKRSAVGYRHFGRQPEMLRRHFRHGRFDLDEAKRRRPGRQTRNRPQELRASWRSPRPKLRCPFRNWASTSAHRPTRRPSLRPQSKRQRPKGTAFAFCFGFRRLQRVKLLSLPSGAEGSPSEKRQNVPATNLPAESSRKMGLPTRSDGSGEPSYGDFYFSLSPQRLSTVTPGQSSVRKGVAGRPSRLRRLHTGLSAQA